MTERLMPSLTLVLLVGMFLTAAGWAGVVTEPEVDTTTPEASVESLHDALIEAMKIPGEDGYERRVELLDPVVRSLFDFRMISRLVLGSHWRDAGGEQREAFLDVFSRYSVANYASEFASFSDQVFRTIETVDQRRGVVVVRSTLESGGGETHRFDYQLRARDGRWLIIGVAVDGVSDIATKRTQYNAVIKRDGFDALLGTLEEKIRDFERGGEDDD